MIPNEHNFTIKELRAICRLLEYQYVTNEDIEINDVMNRIFRIVREHDDMARRTRKST